MVAFKHNAAIVMYMQQNVTLNDSRLYHAVTLAIVTGFLFGMLTLMSIGAYQSMAAVSSPTATWLIIAGGIVCWLISMLIWSSRDVFKLSITPDGHLIRERGLLFTRQASFDLTNLASVVVMSYVGKIFPNRTIRLISADGHKMDLDLRLDNNDAKELFLKTFVQYLMRSTVTRRGKFSALPEIWFSGGPRLKPYFDSLQTADQSITMGFRKH